MFRTPEQVREHVHAPAELAARLRPHEVLEEGVAQSGIGVRDASSDTRIEVRLGARERLHARVEQVLLPNGERLIRRQLATLDDAVLHDREVQLVHGPDVRLLTQVLNGLQPAEGRIEVVLRPVRDHPELLASQEIVGTRGATGKTEHLDGGLGDAVDIDGCQDRVSVRNRPTDVGGVRSAERVHGDQGLQVGRSRIRNGGIGGGLVGGAGHDVLTSSSTDGQRDSAPLFPESVNIT